MRELVLRLVLSGQMFLSAAVTRALQREPLPTYPAHERTIDCLPLLRECVLELDLGLVEMGWKKWAGVDGASLRSVPVNAGTFCAVNVSALRRTQARFF